MQRVPDGSSSDWHLNYSSCAVVSCYRTPSTISSIVSILLCPTAHPSSRCPSGLFIQFLQMLELPLNYCSLIYLCCSLRVSLTPTYSHRQLTQLRYSAQNNTPSMACIHESTNNGQRLPWWCSTLKSLEIKRLCYHMVHSYLAT